MRNVIFILYIIFSVCFLSLACVLLSYNMKHPELTEMQVWIDLFNGKIF